MQPRLLRSPARLAGTSLLKLQNDERLVSLARDGHEQAFAAIVERYGSQLERYASRLVGPTRAEDALQQAFVNAHSALIKDPEKTIELRPWLYRIVHNAALNTLRSARDEVPLGDDTDRLGLADDAIERRELLREALEAVAALPQQQRDAIILRELEGRSHDEIAVALGVTPGAARQQIFRARAALRSAATAITPAPLIVRLLEMAAASGSGAGDVATAAGGGLAAVLAKASAGVLVTGAVAGGAVGAGVVDVPGTHHKTPLSAQATAETYAPSAKDAARARQPGTLSIAAAEHRSGNENGSGASSSHGKKTRRHRGSGSGRQGSTDSSGRSGDSASTLVNGRTDSSGPGSVSSSGSSGSADDTSAHRQSRGSDDSSGSSGRRGGSGRRGSSNSGSGRHGSGSGSGKGGSHHSGSGSGKGGSHHSGSGSGKGSSHGGETQSAEAEAQHVEAEAPGDVSGKPATGGGGAGGNATTTPAAPVAPAATGGGGGGGGGKVSQNAPTPAPAGGGGK